METIRHLRMMRGWSQPELAVLVGVTPGTISSWEHGLTHPTAIHVAKLARVFDVQVEEIALMDESAASKPAVD